MSFVERCLAVVMSPFCVFGDGASHNQDAIDLRIVEEVRKGKGKIVSDPASVGNWPVKEYSSIGKHLGDRLFILLYPGTAAGRSGTLCHDWQATSCRRK